MSSSFGNRISVTLFGESHGPKIGAVLQGLPAGLPLDFEWIRYFLSRRKAKKEWTTSRIEEDGFQIISGIKDGHTTGMPLTALFDNQNAHSGDYDFLSIAPRPGHVDFPAAIRSSFQDELRGGGHHSGRLTLPYCFCGAVAIQYLQNKGISIASRLSRIGTIQDKAIDTMYPDLSNWKSCSEQIIPMLDLDASKQAEALLKSLIAEGDSIGAQVECIATGLPIGLGLPYFNSMESVLSHALFSIPGVKSVSFGDEAVYMLKGSAYNDCYRKGTQHLECATNHAGGINGGYTNGMPLVVRADFRPTASIAKPQTTAKWDGELTTLSIHGRHDPCIALRALPAVESAVALTVMDLFANDTF